VIDAVELRSEGSLIDAELVVKAKNLGFTIQQMGIDYFVRVHGSSTLSSFRVIRQIFRELVTLYPEMRDPRRRQPIVPPVESAAVAVERAAGAGEASAPPR
jgi:hypothetical protein